MSSSFGRMKRGAWDRRLRSSDARPASAEATARQSPADRVRASLAAARRSSEDQVPSADDGTSPSTGEVALPTSERTPSTCPIKILTPVLDFFPGTEFF